jgi:hypothetical protein
MLGVILAGLGLRALPMLAAEHRVPVYLPTEKDLPGMQTIALFDGGLNEFAIPMSDCGVVKLFPLEIKTQYGSLIRAMRQTDEALYFIQNGVLLQPISRVALMANGLVTIFVDTFKYGLAFQDNRLSLQRYAMVLMPPRCESPVKVKLSVLDSLIRATSAPSD